MKPLRHSGGYPKSKMHQRLGNIALLTQVLHLLLCILQANNDKYYQKNCKCGYLQSSQYIFQQELGVRFSY